MKSLTPQEREWIALVAFGAFSFRMDGLRLTTAGGLTFCASTYNAMMVRGWVEPVVSVRSESVWPQAHTREKTLMFHL